LRTDEIVVIGAGPYGLSISAHLRDMGVSHRIVGRPVDTWRTRMPAGMNLKSEPYASDIAAPRAGYDVEAYSRVHGLEYVKRLGPVPLKTFVDYADWYVKELTPDVTDITVTDVTPADGGFRIAFADADAVLAKQVVVATGPLPYAVTPAELSGLAPDLVSHTSDHHRLDKFRGRRVAVIGAGQSALETVALLHEAGAEAMLIVRRPEVSWLTPLPAELSPIAHIRQPATKLCEGWKCVVWSTPVLFRRLPQHIRLDKARTVLGPVGSWWLKDRVEGVVEVLAGHQVRAAQPVGDGVQLQLSGPERSSVDVDHVMAGTGFRVDVTKLPFLSEDLRASITALDGYPVLSRRCESSVPGLYFAGTHAAFSLGPAMRFLAGTHTTGRQIAQALADRAGRKGDSDTQPSRPADNETVPVSRS